MNYLNGYMYHMSHFDNLRSILEEGALLSQQELDKNSVKVHSIANQEVQNLRKRIYVWNLAESQYRLLHSYVPFYFVPHTPMFHNQQTAGIQNDVIFFKASRAYIGAIDHTVVFTDGNASNQQLSKYREEKVYITPATLKDNSCQRKYQPADGPYGTNDRRSDFYANEEFLNRLNWDAINGSTSVEDYKRLRQAEVLVPDRFPLDEMLSIIVGTNKMVSAVNSLLSELDIVLGQYDLVVERRPDLFI